jgi:hypothetical protein
MCSNRRIVLAFFTPHADLGAEDTWWACVASRLNGLSAWYTAVGSQPQSRFSHVEIVLESGYSYSIRWGEVVHEEKRTYGDDNYGFVAIDVSPEQYACVESRCKAAVQRSDSFDYAATVLNFTCLGALFPYATIDGDDDDDDDDRTLGSTQPSGREPSATFCSAFVTHVLIDAHILESTAIDAQRTSPNSLWAHIITLLESPGTSFRTVPHPFRELPAFRLPYSYFTVQPGGGRTAYSR